MKEKSLSGSGRIKKEINIVSLVIIRRIYASISY